MAVTSHHVFDVEHLPTGIVQIAAMLGAAVITLHSVFQHHREEGAAIKSQVVCSFRESKREKVFAGLRHAGCSKRGDAAAVIVSKAFVWASQLFIDIKNNAGLSGSGSVIGWNDLVHEGF